jgi:hypothetical protein
LHQSRHKRCTIGYHLYDMGDHPVLLLFNTRFTILSDNPLNESWLRSDSLNPHWNDCHPESKKILRYGVSGMSYCEECGAKVADNVLFCDSCGRDITEQWVCKECGRQISENQSKTSKGYCSICTPRQKDPARRQGSWPLVLGGIVSIYIGLLLIVLPITRALSSTIPWPSPFTPFLLGIGLFHILFSIFLLWLHFQKFQRKIRHDFRSLFFILLGLGMFSFGSVVSLVYEFMVGFPGLPTFALVCWSIGVIFILLGVALLPKDRNSSSE